MMNTICINQRKKSYPYTISGTLWRREKRACKKMLECNMHVVWIDGSIKAWDYVIPG